MPSKKSVRTDRTERPLDDDAIPAISDLDLPESVESAINEIVSLERQLESQGEKKACPGDYVDPSKAVIRYIGLLQRRIDGLLKPLEFKYAPNRPLLIVKMGDANRGWVPNAKHFDAVRKVLKAAGEDERHNILLHHFGINVEKH